MLLVRRALISFYSGIEMNAFPSYCIRKENPFYCEEIKYSDYNNSVKQNLLCIDLKLAGYI